MAEGKSNAEIAVILGLTAGTVKLHVERILTKLHAENRTIAALIVHGVHF
jgi:DNA-binding NarL/FixJ family response regulator